MFAAFTPYGVKMNAHVHCAIGDIHGDLERLKDLHRRRIHHAEEKPMALPAKLTLPLIFFVFPVLLGVLTSPAMVMLGRTLPP